MFQKSWHSNNCRFMSSSTSSFPNNSMDGNVSHHRMCEPIVLRRSKHVNAESICACTDELADNINDVYL